MSKRSVCIALIYSALMLSQSVEAFVFKKESVSSLPNLLVQYTKALQGDIDATINVGLLYLDSYHMDKNERRANHFIGRAARLGSEHHLKRLHQLANQSFKNRRYSRSALILSQLAKQRDDLAMLKFSFMQQYGLGVQKDEELAVKWLEKAATNGCYRAMRVLALRFEEGKGVDKSYVQAAKWFARAKESNGQLVAIWPFELQLKDYLL